MKYANVPIPDTLIESYPGIDSLILGEIVNSGFSLLAVNPVYHIDSVTNYLYTYPDVVAVSPYFTDTTGLQMTIGDKISCKFQPEVPRSFVDSLNEGYGVVVYEEKTTGDNRFLLEVTDSAQLSTLDIANLYYELDETVYSHPDFVFGLIADEYKVYDYYRQFQWNIARVSMAESVDDRHRAWEITTGDSEIIVAVLDDGVAVHEDLPSGRLLLGFNTVTNTYNGSPCSGNTHGQAVAGLVAASHTTDSLVNGDPNTGMYGVAPGCMILPIHMFQGSCDTGTIAPQYIERAIDTAVAWGADIIVGSCHFNLPWDEMDRALYDAQRFGRNGRGCPIVFSTGNVQFVGDAITGYPASNSVCIAVAATDDWDTLAAYSKRSKLDVVAPGGTLAQWMLSLDQMAENGKIKSTSPIQCTNPVDPDYWCSFIGTSASAPQAAGVLALILSYDSTLMEYEARGLLEASADIYLADTNYYRPNPTYGWGMVSPLKALIAMSRGDVNNDREITVSDLTYLVDWIYKGGPEPIPHEWRADVNCDAARDVTDVTFLVDVLWGDSEIEDFCISFDGWYW